MTVSAVIGAQWGDEGKGKVVDFLAEKADVVVRFSGGDNAGHTVINKYGKFALHLVPSGIFSEKAVSIIGNGTVVNPAILLQELKMLTEKGVECRRLFISDRAHVIMPYHILLDDLEEKRLGAGAHGTTKRGIGPAYIDKYARVGIRTCDIIDPKSFLEQLSRVIDFKNLVLTRIYGVEPLSLQKIYDEYCAFGERLKPMIRDVTGLVQEAIDANKLVLMEGAQGTMLDPEFGTYPFTSSPNSFVAGCIAGAGIGPTRIDNVVGVFKAYCTRVGAGPMPTELTDEMGEMIRERGHEYGATTGRPRRCGWFDAVAARFSNRVNGFTGMAITRLDILDTLPSIKICTGYKIGNRNVEDFPASLNVLKECQPVYEELEGWQTITCGVRNFEDLPPKARSYIRRLEEVVGCPADIVCIGPERDQTIVRNSAF